MSEAITTTAGIDVSKSKLDVYVGASDRDLQVTNTPDGWRDLAQALAKAGIRRVGLEASGGYEHGVASALHKANFHVLVLQPSEVRHYAQFRRWRAKNDRLDARAITHCAAASEQRAFAPQPALQALAAWMTFYEQITEDLARAKIRRDRFAAMADIAKELESEIAHLTKRKMALIARLQRQLRCDQELGPRLALVQSIPGIGFLTAVSLIVRVPELGAVKGRHAAALVGLAPYDDDSGVRRGSRSIQGGRARPRKFVFMAALAATRPKSKSPLAAFYRHLIAQGKRPRVALVACMRKLVIYANAVLIRGTPWKLETQS